MATEQNLQRSDGDRPRGTADDDLQSLGAAPDDNHAWATSLKPGRRFSSRGATTAVLNNVVWLLLIIICIVAGMMNSFFLSVPNLQNILVQATVLGFVSLSVALALLLGEIDLSIIGNLVFSGTIGALLMKAGIMSGLTAILVVIAIGALIGAVNGVCIAYMRMNSLITTLAMGLILGGAVLALTKSQTISIGDPVYLYAGTAHWGTWPVMPVALVLIYALAWLVLTRTTFGRRVYAVGGNARAAVATGIRVPRVKFAAFVVGGALCGAAGVLQTSYLGGVNSTVASTILLYAVAAPVIGGVSLQGGRGHVLGMLGGVLLITVIQVALQIVNISAYYVQMAGGIVIFIAVMFDASRIRFNR